MRVTLADWKATDEEEDARQVWRLDHERTRLASLEQRITRLTSRRHRALETHFP